jgi:hypothetical protein
VELLEGKLPTVNVTGVCDEWEQHLSPNVRRWAVRLDFFNNFDASSTGSSIVAGIATILQTVLASTASTGVAFVMRKTTGTRSATNPEFSGYVGLDGDFLGMGGKMAEAEKGSVVLKGMGDLSRFTSAT